MWVCLDGKEAWKRRGPENPPSLPQRAVEGSGFKDKGSGIRVQGLGIRDKGLGIRVEDLGIRIYGKGWVMRVEG